MSSEEYIKNKNTEWISNNSIVEKYLPASPMTNITLSKAGTATGAVVDTNLLAKIYNYALLAGIPFEEAIGLINKESTLGNPSTDWSYLNIVKKGSDHYNSVKHDLEKYGVEQHKHNPYNPTDILKVVNF